MRRASLVVFMSAVFARAQWRYPFARAYRTILAEAGHHAQSFCLLATALDLAPFCTMAFADSHVERWLGLDGRRTATSATRSVSAPDRRRRTGLRGRIPLAPRDASRPGWPATDSASVVR